LAKAFQSEFTAEDRALANKLGYSEEALLGGAWLGGVGNVRKFLRSGVDTSDRGWSPSGAGSSVAEYMRLFNNQGGTGANGGGVPKYKDGGTVGRDSGDFRDFSDTDYTARQDKTYVASPQLYPEARRMYPQPSQQPTVGQYVKKTPYEQRLIDTQVAERRKSQWLYDNQHLWNVNSMNGIQPNITPENVDFEFNNSKDTAKATAETLAFEAGAPFMLGAALKGGEYVKNANIPGKVSDTVKKLWNDARGTTVYTGDPLELYLKRLNNGGYKKLGIDPNKVIEVPDQMFLDQHTSTHANRLHTVADALYQQRPIFKKTTIADDVENMKVVTFDDLRSILSRESRSAYNPISNHIGLDRIDMSSTTRKGIALAHELDHKVLSMTNRTNHDYADLSTFLKHNPNESVVSATTAIKSPLNLPALTDIPGTDVSKVLDANGNVDHALGAYFLGSDGAESIARTGQLKNFFGMTNPNKKLTVRQFNFAKKHYPTHKYGTDNDMVNFFKFVTKPKEFLKWANPRTIGVVPAVPILSSELADKNKKIKHNK
jgi:hypothetical protein